jgi:hypothetical protein
MDFSHINRMLMLMGGDKCKKSHLLKHCSNEDIAQAINENYLIEQKIGEEIFIFKTNKAKNIG